MKLLGAWLLLFSGAVWAVNCRTWVAGETSTLPSAEKAPAKINRRYVGSPAPVLDPSQYAPSEKVFLYAIPGSTEALLKKETAVFGTWNIENFFYHVGKFVPDPLTGQRHLQYQPKPKLEKDLLEILSRLNRIKPDFMAFQEIENTGRSDSLKSFVQDRVSKEYVACDVQGNDGRGIRVGQMSRGFNVQYESHRDLPWVDPYDPPMYPQRQKLFSRDLPAAILFIPGFEEPYAIVLIEHGKSQRTEITADKRSEIIRGVEQVGVAALVKYYERRYPRVPVYVMGDFNAELIRREFIPVLQTGVGEVFETLPTRFVSRGDRLTQSYHPLNRKGYELRAVHGQLDYILANEVGKKYVLDSWVERPIDENGRAIPLAQSYAQRALRGGSDHDARVMVFDNRRRLLDMGVGL